MEYTFMHPEMDKKDNYKLKFEKKEKVLVSRDQLRPLPKKNKVKADNNIYEAKILDCRQHEYKIHYRGYNKRYDEWVNASHIFKTTINKQPIKNEIIQINDISHSQKSKKRPFDDMIHSQTSITKRQKLNNEKKVFKTFDNDNNNINHIIKHETMETIHCANCKISLQTKDKFRCSNCKLSYYCNQQCQSKHWNIHKFECNKEINVKTERVSVNDWNCCGIIYWLNRVNNGIFSNDKYRELRRHIVIGELRGYDLVSINNVTLKMMGIKKEKEQKIVLNALMDVVMNDNFDNRVANEMQIVNDDIRIQYFDAMSYEILNDPVKIKSSGYIYNKEYITKYIQLYKIDPITKQKVDLEDIVVCKQLKDEIYAWKKAKH
eukprot:395917_1